MRNTIYSKSLFSLLCVAGVITTSCTDKLEIDHSKDYKFPAHAAGTSLQSFTDFPIGFGISNSLYLNNPIYKQIVDQNASVVTLEYAMKHGAMVGADGSIDFSKVDQVLSSLTQAGLTLYGHTLAWHQNQNGDYLRSLVSGGGSAVVATNLMTRGDFEDGDITGWARYNGTENCNNIVSGGNRVYSGTYALEIVSSRFGNPWDTQIAAPNFEGTMISGHEYEISFYIRSVADGGQGRASTRGTAKYQPTFTTTTEWEKKVFRFTSDGGEVGFNFDMGFASNTFYIDEAKVVNLTDPYNGEEPAGANLLENGTFEEGIEGWTRLNGVADALQHTTGGNRVHTGVGAMRIFNNADNPGGQWRTQIKSSFNGGVDLEADKTYALTFWIRSEAPGSGRCSTTGNAQYQGDFNTSTDWTKITWQIVAKGGENGFCFDMGASAGTYYIDDVSFTEVIDTGGNEEDPEVELQNREAIDAALRSWITETVTHYKGKVKAWDVVNEAMADGDSGLRYGDGDAKADLFYWTDYLGRDYGVKAFKYAKESDPNALLFINDYNLESNPAKLDSLLSYIQEIEAKGAQVDGIGTQMHITYRQYNYDEMFRKMAATGKLVKITELDVKVNIDKLDDYVQSPMMQDYQAVTYQAVIESYIKNVPAAQRYGVTFWNVSDADTWLINETPCLFDTEYQAKSAYSGVIQGLKKK